MHHRSVATQVQRQLPAPANPNRAANQAHAEQSFQLSERELIILAQKVYHLLRQELRWERDRLG